MGRQTGIGFKVINKKPHWLWRWKGWLILLLVPGLLVFVGWRFPQELLLVDAGPVKADVIVVLGGGPTVRPERAAVLYRAGESLKILVCGSGDDLANQRMLESNGVPASVIWRESKSHTTFENAKFSIPLLRQMGAKRVIIVTSWYHSRRALATFKHLAPDITFYSRPSYYAYARSEWSSTGLKGYIKMEYLKITGYWLCHGVWPF